MPTATATAALTRIDRSQATVGPLPRPAHSTRPAHSSFTVRVPAPWGGEPPTTAVYRRRRAGAVMFLMAFAVAVAVVVGSVASAGRAAPVGDGPAQGQRTYLVQPGDTLWAVADRYRGAIGQADYVALLVEVNGGAGIEAGELIALP